MLCATPVNCSTWGVIKNGTWDNGAIIANENTNWITLEPEPGGGWDNAVESGGNPPANAHAISSDDWDLLKGGDCFDGYIKNGSRCYCLVENGDEVEVNLVTCPE
jgi:hypothetical protein